MRLLLFLIAISTLSLTLAQVGQWTQVPRSDWNSPNIRMALSFGSYNLANKVIQENAFNANSVTYNVDKIIEIRSTTSNSITYYFLNIHLGLIVTYPDQNDRAEYAVASTIQLKLDSGIMSAVTSTYTLNLTDGFDYKVDLPTYMYDTSSYIRGIIDYGASYVYRNTPDLLGSNGVGVWYTEVVQITQKMHGEATYYEAHVYISDDHNVIDATFEVRVFSGEQSIVFWYSEVTYITPPAEEEVAWPIDWPVEEEDTATPPVEEEAPVAWPVEEETTVPWPVEEEDTVTPPVEEEVTVTPPAEEEVAWPIDWPVEEEDTATPPVEEEATVTPPVEEEYTATAPAEEEVAWPIDLPVEEEDTATPPVEEEAPVVWPVEEEATVTPPAEEEVAWPVEEEYTATPPVEEEAVIIPQEEEAEIDDRTPLHIVGLGFPVSASSTYSLQHFNYMLNSLPQVTSGAGAWCSRQRDSEQWIQVSSIVPVEWAAISTQGRSDDDMWVTSFSVLYSNDGNTWNSVDNGRVFNGNTDRNSIVTQWFDHSVTARTLRIIPMTWQTSICMRFDALAWDV